ncbi:MAG TPA: MaoC family dehydratase N-terminal domain-containing protein [Amycolatopsis sp.]|uniref:FAS1-like dehydratase domain-containing protein n=1 Tax=Amycolatopsis sp. TaxID=37632 RepID=UPI002B4874DA|nr:MaoC family dehydratase N-terminal domain-containing protein [Amycolatopsis sp.]HKS46475.1 MaoC family dehydratase N-terminal domain-containing protein [Amycolatopsis sp.]
MTSDLDERLADWRPEPRTRHDVLTAGPVAALSAVLDQPAAAAEGDPLPPLWHWLYFLDWPPQAELGVDGHPAVGHFLPPIPDRRRMFAGGRLRVHRPLTVGERAEQVATLASAVVKRGRTGEMVFVTVRSEFCQRAETCLVEELDYVYRSGEDARRSFTAAGAPVPSSEAAWQLVPRISPTLLFRFSALTANAHRIHYDAPYARGTEGYPGLVVHGPLLVLLMLELVRRTDSRSVAEVDFRLRRPVFAGDGVLARGGPDGRLAIATSVDERHATAEVRFA